MTEWEKFELWLDEIVGSGAASQIAAAMQNTGWRPPARVIETVEELDACDDFAILYWLDDSGLPHTYVAVQMKQHWASLAKVMPQDPFWPVTVVWESGDPR